jgi:formiminotetrahydrofolate cyclodeaminase
MSASDGRIASLSLAEFGAALASQEATPGGGSAAAAVASLGASLGSMVIRLSLGRPAHEAHAELLRASQEVTEAARGRFLDLADDDVRAFDRYTQARRLPRETPEQTAVRAAAMAEAISAATAVPVRVVEESRMLMGILEGLAGRTNPNVASDLEVAVLLVDAAALGAAANVTTNLRSMHDHDAAARIGARVEDALGAIRLAVDRTRSLIRAPEGVTPPTRSP